jgi:hypothetical protein
MWSTFTDNKLNPLDVMVMASQEEADKIIERVKREIDMGTFNGSIDIDDTIVLDNDIKRIERTIKQYLEKQ